MRLAVAALFLALPAIAAEPEVVPRMRPAGPGSGCVATCHASLAEGAIVHAPVQADGCDACHEYVGEGKRHQYRLPQKVDGACLACHDDPRAKGKVVHGPARDGACTECHDPHRSRHPALLKRSSASLCDLCHGNVRQDLSKPSVHALALDPGCGQCHDPHAAPAPGLLPVAVNDFCLACHATRAVFAAADEHGEVVLFGDRRFQRERLARAPRIGLDAGGGGHPVSGHPVDNVWDPRQPNVRLNCVSCHDPHGAFKPHLVRGPQNGWLICRQCHKK